MHLSMSLPRKKIAPRRAVCERFGQRLCGQVWREHALEGQDLAHRDEPRVVWVLALLSDSAA